MNNALPRMRRSSDSQSASRCGLRQSLSIGAVRSIHRFNHRVRGTVIAVLQGLSKRFGIDIAGPQEMEAVPSSRAIPIPGCGPGLADAVAQKFFRVIEQKGQQFLRQSLHEFAGHSIAQSEWFAPITNNSITGAKSAMPPLRALAFKWAYVPRAA